MCSSMADIHSATAEIRRGKKERRRRKNKRQDENIYGLPYYIKKQILLILEFWEPLCPPSSPIMTKFGMSGQTCCSPRQFRLDRNLSLLLGE